MTRLADMVRAFVREEDGIALTEYLILLGLFTAAVISPLRRPDQTSPLHGIAGAISSRAPLLVRPLPESSAEAWPCAYFGSVVRRSLSRVIRFLARGG